MTERNINIFEFPTNLGLRKKPKDSEPDVKLLPESFRRHNFHKLIKPQQIIVLNPPEYTMEMDEESGVLNANLVIKFAIEQAKLFNKFLENNTFQIILGGDCSILIGNALALKQKGTYGLFFLDGHTDYLLPELSLSKQVAAMELAIVTGLGHDKLTNILNLKPYFEEAYVWCVGNREFDLECVETILNSDINYFDLNVLRKIGTKQCTAQFLQMIEDNGLDGFLIHLDVDVLNDSIMPAVDTRQLDGLMYSELNEILSYLLSSSKAIGIEITILDPTLDKKGIYTSELVANLVNVLNTSVNI